MGKVLSLIAGASALALLSISAQALPAFPAKPAVANDVIEVAQGCGRGWYRDRFGRCVRYMGPGPGIDCWWVRRHGRWVMVCR